MTEKFNTYRFADCKGHVFEVPICVSIETIEIKNAMKALASQDEDAEE